MTKLKIIIHAGMHKTGTTALQTILAEKRVELLELGVFYPECGALHHNYMLNLRRQDWSPQLLLEQLSLANKKGVSTVIFSAEVVSILSAEEAARLRDCLGDNDVEFLFVFRHWCEYLPSRWAQNCRVRDSQTLNEYLHNLRYRYPEHLDIRYDLILERFQSTPNSKVIAVSYSNPVKLNRPVLSDVFAAMGFSTQQCISLLQDERVVNQRLGWAMIEKIRLLNCAISQHLGLNYSVLFKAGAEFGVGDVSYNLSSKLREFTPDLLDRLSETILSNKAQVVLSDEDEWINDLNKGFQRTSSHYFTNLYENKIFYGNYNVSVDCLTISYQDIKALFLDDSIKKFKLEDFS